MDKTIHYCWFGGNPLSETAVRSLASWEKFAPGFEVKQWNEDNFDFALCSWSRDAYAASLWAFVSDYARFKVLYEYGGIYMDIGSELIRDISPLMESIPFTAIEESSLTATTGLIVAVEPHDPVIRACIERYESMKFSSDPDFLDKTTVNEVFTAELQKIGLPWTPKRSTPFTVSAVITSSVKPTVFIALREAGLSRNISSRGRSCVSVPRSLGEGFRRFWVEFSWSLVTAAWL